MRKLLITLVGFLTIIFLIYLQSSFMNHKKQDISMNEFINLTNKSFADKDFKAKDANELSNQDFETAYNLGKAFLNDYYSQKAGYSKIDFEKYIINENLLRYSTKRFLVEDWVRDIKEISSVGISKAELIYEENAYYFEYVIVTKDSNIGGFSEKVELLISNNKGNLAISDWYISWGAGSSSFDERFRPNETIKSPTVWDDQEYVNNIFKKIDRAN